MSKCKSCGRSVPFYKRCDGGVCSSCYDAAAERSKAERKELIPQLLEKYCGEQIPSTFAFVHWDVKDRQTVLKDVGQAVVSAAFSAVPIVGGRDVIGHVGLLAVVESEVVFVDFGTVEFGGSISITEKDLKAFLATTEKPDVHRVAMEKVYAEHNQWTDTLVIPGYFFAGLSLTSLSSDEMPYTKPTIPQFVNAINAQSRRKTATPKELAAEILQVPPRLPTARELEEFSEIPAYVVGLFRAFMRLNRADKEKALPILVSLPRSFQEPILVFCRCNGAGAEKPKIAPFICFGLAAIFVLASLFVGRDGWPTFWIGATILALAGWITNVRKNSKRWYRHYLEEFEKQMPPRLRE